MNGMIWHFIQTSTIVCVFFLNLSLQTTWNTSLGSSKFLHCLSFHHRASFLQLDIISVPLHLDCLYILYVAYIQRTYQMEWDGVSTTQLRIFNSTWETDLLQSIPTVLLLTLQNFLICYNISQHIILYTDFIDGYHGHGQAALPSKLYAIIRASPCKKFPHMIQPMHPNYDPASNFCNPGHLLSIP